MSDSNDQEKTALPRRQGVTPATPDTAAEAAAAPSAEREAERSQEQGSPSPGRASSIDSVDFDVTAGLGDEALAEPEGFFDVTEGAAAAAPNVPIPPAPSLEPPSMPPVTAEPAAAGGTVRRTLMALAAAAAIAVVLWFLIR